MKKFNVIIYDSNFNKFITYDIIPYLVSEYKETKFKPHTLEEFIEFIINKSRYQWWSRCEYEVVLQSWPSGRAEEKIDVHWQVMMNIEIIAKILMSEVSNE